MEDTARREVQFGICEVATGRLFYFYGLPEKMQKPEQRKYQLLQALIMAH